MQTAAKEDSIEMDFKLVFFVCFLIGYERVSSYPLEEDDNEEKREDGMTLDIKALEAKQGKHGDISLVTVDQLHSMLQNNDVRLIDVRNPGELKQEGKIGRAINIPLLELDSALKLSDDDFKSKYEMTKPSKDDCNLVFHCRSGVRSLKAAQIAKQNGYKCPKSLKGGFTAWKEMAETGR